MEVNSGQSQESEDRMMDGKQSYEGIVVRKLARKAEKASESTQVIGGKASLGLRKVCSQPHPERYGQREFEKAAISLTKPNKRNPVSCPLLHIKPF